MIARPFIDTLNSGTDERSFQIRGSTVAEAEYFCLAETCESWRFSCAIVLRGDCAVNQSHFKISLYSLHKNKKGPVVSGRALYAVIGMIRHRVEIEER
jgi:hypothetical protein